MNTTILREEIQWLLEAINEQYEVIKTHEDKIPQIEFDILMENVRSLYEKLHLYNRSNDPFAMFDHPVKETVAVKIMEPIATRASVTEKIEPGPKEGTPVIKIHYDETVENFSKTESSSTDQQWQGADLFNSELTGFSGKLQEARQQSLGPRGKRTTSNDLKAMISINEKFLFINELFDGNLREYNETIEALNRFSDARSALEFLDLSRKKNLWNSESIAFSKLKELLEERFKQ